MKVNLKEFGSDSNIPEGVYSLSTRDLGAQYFLIKRQHPDNPFAGGELLVYKVEIVASYHEEIMFRNKRWWIWYNDEMSSVLAYKMFAFISNQGISVWKRYQDNNYPLGDAATIAETPATIVITDEDVQHHSLDREGRRRYWRSRTAPIPAPSGTRTIDVSLWQSYGKILWEYITESRNLPAITDAHGRQIVHHVSPAIPGGARRPLDGEYLVNAGDE
jgi:hypothetical protein